MRILMIPLLLATLPVLAGDNDDLFVVVHTADRVVVDYTCSALLAVDDPTAPVVRSEVQAAGMFTWHVVGGVAPYTVVKDNESAGGGCITVVDAVGHTATGCGVVGEVHVRRIFNCDQQEDTTLTGRYLAPPPPEVPPTATSTPPPPTHGPDKPHKTSTPDTPPPVKGPHKQHLSTDGGNGSGGHTPDPPHRMPSSTPSPRTPRIAPNPGTGGNTTYHGSTPSGGGGTTYSGTGQGSGGINHITPVPH